MFPRVRGDLVAVAVHAGDDVAPLWGGVDVAFGEVGAGEEECGFNVFGPEEVEELVGVDVGAVVEGATDGGLV